MLSKIKFLLPVVAGAVMLQACNKNNDEFHTTADGLKYKIFEQGENGEYENKGEVAADDTTGARIGQVAAFHWTIQNSEDSVFADTRKQVPAFPIMLPVSEPTMRGGLENAIMMLSPGDSGVFKVNADTLFAKTFKQPLPPFIKPGSELTFFIKSERVMSQEEAQAYQQEMFQQYMQEAQARAEKQKVVDDEKIQAYIKEQGLENVQKTESGLYYVVTQEGSGAPAKAGDKVSVHYKGTFLDGKQFDSSYENPMANGEPFQFQLGQGQVIPGWDEGIQKLNKGGKAILLVPSPLAYGEQDRGADMPANSILRFDVELVDVQQ
ncbi:FKBP-type peptidyl-prolyl cis-trans isomerase [Pontibacter harenae]|uniref:FKBP-type peptidyl-prolyl cis-trans isomerase n=1 Tax=Pontibacter harenae TaxID=2894083 RepID=UPI001E51EBE2|nr:FKBP-type peptidyl-prolyl cis-trans isomerase [Pontibacter harenae]MCC9167792.1 FKBP-type peptidyl-prolyl cis-trans isomerase [Pontibacter harenae]